MRYGIATGVLIAAALSCRHIAAQPPTSFRADYTVEVKDTAAHLFHVTATFSGLHQPRLDLALPAWTPGWYTIENYAKNVLRFTVTDGAGTRLRAPLSHASTWSIDTRGKTQVTAAFDYLANITAVNQAKVTSTWAFFTGTQLFLEPVGHRATPATVRFVLPSGWRIATALRDTKDSTVYTAADYDALVDAPTMLGAFDLYRFEVDGKPHFIVQKSVAPIPADSVARVTTRFAAMIRAERAIFGSLPYEKYLVFQLPGTPESNASGVLEHGNSYVGATGPLLVIYGPNAHEFFHLWNVKRIRPAEMWPYDYSRSNETPSLWVSEGFTQYYGALVSYRAGFTADTTLFASLAGTIGSIESNAASRYLSPSDASLSTWLGYDTPVAFQISYYATGEMLGALLDLSIRHDTRGVRGLDDVMRGLYTRYYVHNKGFTPADLIETVSSAAGRDYTRFFQRFVTGVEVPPYDSILAYAGLLLHLPRGDTTVAVFNAANQEDAQGRRIIFYVRPGGPAALAGLRKDDILTAADSVPIRDVQWFRVFYPGAAGRWFPANPGARVVFTILRDGVEMKVPVTLGTERLPWPRPSIEADPAVSAEQLVVRRAWLARP